MGHLEPWEKGSRKTAGQTGMCGGVSNLIYLLVSLFVFPCLYYFLNTDNFLMHSMVRGFFFRVSSKFDV